MPRSRDDNLAQARHEGYLGIARVNLDALNFQHTLAREKHREVSAPNVLRLEKIFERNGCLRLQEENVIDAIVDQDNLSSALADVGLSNDNLRSLRWPQDAPLVHLEKVKCLSGLHRVQAAHRYLDENDKWWTVRLYRHDTPKPTLTRIIESYAYEQRPSDGEIFRKIRLYHRAKNQESEDRWWACLEKSKPKDLNQLLKRRTLSSAFDRLIDMPGLWTKVQIGALHRLLVLKCDEEMAIYLLHIANSWKGILRCNQRTLPLSSIDTVTVQSLEHLAPGVSSNDKDLVEDLMERGVLFPTQSDECIRQELLDNICSFSGLIPSLQTFFDMLKYIEPTCDALKKLLGKNMKRTVRSSLQGLFWAPAQACVQMTESDDAVISTEINSDECFMIAYTELWAFCSRHFDGLTSFTPLKEIHGPKPIAKGPNPVAWQHLARFAISRGFKIPNAEALVEAGEECYSQLALEYLHKVHPTKTAFSTEEIENVVTRSRLPSELDGSAVVLPDTEPLSRERRSGRPFQDDLVKEKSVLFFPRMFCKPVWEDVTLTYVRQDLYSHIFNPLRLEQTELRTKEGTADTDAMDIDGSPPHARGQDNTTFQDLQRENFELRRTQRETQLQLEKSKALQEDENSKLQRQLVACQSKHKALEASHQESIKNSDTLRNDHEMLKARCSALNAQIAILRTAPGLEERRDTSASPRTEPVAIGTVNVSSVDDAEVALLPNVPWTLPHEKHSRRWEPVLDLNGQLELFVGLTNASDGCLQGHSILISNDPSEGTSKVEHVINEARKSYPGVQLGAATVLAKRITTLESVYLFRAALASKPRTVFIAPESVISLYIASANISIYDTSVVKTSGMTKAKKRRMDEETQIVTKASTTEDGVTIFTAGEDPEGNKRRLLKNTGIVPGLVPLLLTYEPSTATTIAFSDPTILSLTFGSTDATTQEK